jgi:hypothetical protein
MKHGRRLKRSEKELLTKYGLNVDNWLITKRPPGELWLEHRHSGETRVLKVG